MKLTKKFDGLGAVTTITLRKSFGEGVGYGAMSASFNDISLATANGTFSSGNQSTTLNAMEKIQLYAFVDNILLLIEKRITNYLSICCSI